MPSSVATSAPSSRPEKVISWEDFQREYLSREDGYKYEWLNGTIERTPNAMNAAQLYILSNLLNYFMGLKIRRLQASKRPTTSCASRSSKKAGMGRLRPGKTCTSTSPLSDFLWS